MVMAVGQIEDLKTSPYYYLFKDENFRRWFQNVKRGSANTAYEWFRRFGRIHKRFGKLPADFVKMGEKRTTSFILDMVTQLESEKYSGSYISNNVKPIKNWMSFNGKPINQRIKISRRNELVEVAEETTPTQAEVKKIFNAGALRHKAAGALLAFSGVRPESMGDFLGLDGLKIQDLPEMIVKGDNTVEFAKIPTMVIVRPNLSKAGHQYFTFLPMEGCQYLKQYLEWRIRKGETLTAKSAVITQDWWKGNQEWISKSSRPAQGHLRTPNLADVVRRGIRRAGFKWRPYVLRRYFDTRMMVAEMDGMIIRDHRVFWMGHKGDIEHTYTLNKRLPDDIIDKMREAYAKAAERHLVTDNLGGVSRDMVKVEFFKQFLAMHNVPKEQIEKLGDLSQYTAEQVKEFINDWEKRKMGLNGNTQKIISVNDVEKYIMDGWEYVRDLPNNRAIVRLPK